MKKSLLLINKKAKQTLANLQKIEWLCDTLYRV